MIRLNNPSLLRPLLNCCGVALAAFAFLAPGALKAQTTTIYDATGGEENGGDPLDPADAGPLLADRFVAPSTGTLGAVTLNLSLNAASTAAQGFSVALYADAGGTTGPGATLLQIGTVSDASLTGSFALLTLTPGTAFQLTGGQSYYVGVFDTNNSQAILGNTLSSAVLSRPDVSAGADYYNNGGVQVNAGGPYEISVGENVPEPSALVLLALGGAAGVGLVPRQFAARRLA